MTEIFLHEYIIFSFRYKLWFSDQSFHRFSHQQQSCRTVTRCSIQNQNREPVLITVPQHQNHKMPLHSQTFCYCMLIFGNRCNLFPSSPKFTSLKNANGCLLLMTRPRCFHSERAPLFQYSRYIRFGVACVAEHLPQFMPSLIPLSVTLVKATLETAIKPGNCYSRPFSVSFLVVWSPTLSIIRCHGPQITATHFYL